MAEFLIGFISNPVSMWLALAAIAFFVISSAMRTGRRIAEAEAKTKQAEAQRDAALKELHDEVERQEAVARAHRAADAVRDLPVSELREPDKFERK